MKVSFIIPAYNEEECIGQTLVSINKFTPKHINYEIIVVDNGSTDNTSNIVKSLGAQVIKCPSKTIAYARNYGVDSATGDVYIFLDADILLTEEWSFNIINVLNDLVEDKLLVTGSRVLPVDNVTLLNKYWFYRMTTYDAPYINSAHVMTSKELFHSIGGFSAELKTAEDYDFCMKAKNIGAKIVNNAALPVIHLGYPTTIASFIKRERWHGREDFISLRSFKLSKIAWLASLNIVSLLLFLTLSFVFDCYSFLMLYPLTMSSISLFLSVFKFGLAPVSLLMGTSLLFYFYLCGRSLALFDRIFKQ